MTSLGSSPENGGTTYAQASSLPPRRSQRNIGNRSRLETGVLSAAAVGDIASLPRWWRQAGLRTLGYLLNAASHSFCKNSAWPVPCVVRSHHRCESAPEFHRLPV